MQSLTLEFPNGDRVLFGKNNIIHYRRKLVTPDSFGWQNTILTAESGVYPGPLQYALKAALEVAHAAADKAGTQLSLVPQFLPNQIPKPVVKVRCIEKGRCSVTGQSIERVVAEESLIFPHPLHPGDNERVYRVEAGTESGWMPHGIAQGGDVWVDDSSFLSGSARYAIVTNRSKVVGSSVFGSWIRSSTVDLSTTLNSVVQKSSVIDSHIENSGIRSSSIHSAYTKGCALNHSNAAVCDLKETRLANSELTTCIAIKVTGERLSASSSHLLETLIDGCTVVSSFVQNASLSEGKAVNSKITKQEQPTELSQFIMIHNKLSDSRIDDPKNIMVV